jgi:hypothetical protein
MNVQIAPDEPFAAWAPLFDQPPAKVLVIRGPQRRIDEIRAGFGRRRGENCRSTCQCWSDAE